MTLRYDRSSGGRVPEGDRNEHTVLSLLAELPTDPK